MIVLIKDIIRSEKIEVCMITETRFNESLVYADILSSGYCIHLAN